MPNDTWTLDKRCLECGRSLFGVRRLDAAFESAVKPAHSKALRAGKLCIPLRMCLSKCHSTLQPILVRVTKVKKLSLCHYYIAGAVRADYEET